MNLNLYNPPEQWTEEKISEISDEDNRYEFKRGLILNKPQTEFEEDIAKEICALANSFGGTLFLGVIDKTKEIDGVPKIKKGRQSTKAWIEDIIPKLLEFRLPNFRVLEVLLSEETTSKIGSEKTVISIDIYDSDLAPHRSLKDDKYYYRQGSQSVLAPHHYLAFLWGRTSPNMSNVVNSWNKLYLNESINLLETTAKHFEQNKFDTDNETFKDASLNIKKIIFFESEEWNNLNSSLTAKQFLRTFPDIDSHIKEFNTLIENFFINFTKLKELIESSPEFETSIRRAYDEAMFKEGFREPNQFTNKSLEEIIKLYAGQVFDRQMPGLSNYPDEVKKIFIRMTAYNLLNLDSHFESDNSIFFNFCKKYFVEKFDKSKSRIETVLQRIIEIENDVAQKAELLAREIDELRYALALKHNTTFE